MGAGSEHLSRRASQRRALVGETVSGGGLTVQFGRQSPRASALRWQPNDFADPTWGQIYGVLKQCERGDTVNWAHLTRRMLKSDDHLLAVYESRRSAVAGAKYDVKPGGAGERDQLAADDVYAMLDSLPMSRIILDLLDGWFTGYAISEIIWEPRGAWVWPVAIEWLAPHRFRFDDAFVPYLYDNGLLAAEGDMSTQRMGKALTNRKYIVHVPRSIPDYPVSSGVGLACVRPWWIKLTSQKYWLSGAEWAGNPRAVGKYPQSASAEVKEEFYQAIESMAADSPVVMSNESELQILAPLAQGGNSIWSELATRCDAALSKAVLGSTLNVEITTSAGSRAAAESQAATSITPRLMRDSAGVWETLTRDLIRPFLELNAWRYGGVPATPFCEHVFTNEMAPVVDQLLVDVGGATIDELRVSKGLPAWGPEKGGDKIATKVDQPAALPFSDNPAPVVEAGAPVPFGRKLSNSPWESAMRIAAGMAVTGMSGR